MLLSSLKAECAGRAERDETRQFRADFINVGFRFTLLAYELNWRLTKSKTRASCFNFGITKNMDPIEAGYNCKNGV